MKNKLILTLLLLITIAVNAQISSVKDARLIEDSKGRFIGDVKVLGIWNYATIGDKTGFLKDFTLKMKVWDYLGEPLEMYAFQWYRNTSYSVQMDNTLRSMTLDKLEEYPDLHKRFLDLRPTKVDIKISGYAGDGNSSNDLLVGKIKVEESSVPVNVVYTYIVKDVDLLIAREGEFREPTVAGSPPTWNEFFNWQYSDPGGPLINLNVTEDSFKRLSQEEQKQRITKIKNIWKQVKQLSVSATIETLEWPEYEMIDIIKTYDRYKNEKKELSPQEELDEELAEIQNTPEYTKDDEWVELPEIVNPQLIVSKDAKSIKYLNSNKILLEVDNSQSLSPLAMNFKKYKGDESIALIPLFKLFDGKDENDNSSYLIDEKGVKKVNKKFLRIDYYNSDSDFEDYLRHFFTKGDDLFNFKSVSWWHSKVRANTYNFDRKGEYIIAVESNKKTKIITEKIRSNVTYITTYIYDMNFNLIDSFKGMTF